MPARVSSIRMSPPLLKPVPCRRICVAFDSSVGVLSLCASNSYNNSNNNADDSNSEPSAPCWALAYRPSGSDASSTGDPLGISGGGCLLAVERIPKDWLYPANHNSSNNRMQPSSFSSSISSGSKNSSNSRSSSVETPDLFVVTDVDLSEVVRFDAKSERVLGRRRIAKRTGRIADLLWLAEASILAVHATTDIELFYWHEESVALCVVSLLLHVPTNDLSLSSSFAAGSSSLPFAPPGSTMWPQLTGHVADDAEQTINAVASMSSASSDKAGNDAGDDNNDGDANKNNSKNSNTTNGGKRQGSSSATPSTKIVCKVAAAIADPRASHILRAVSVSFVAERGPALLPIVDGGGVGSCDTTGIGGGAASGCFFPVMRSRLLPQHVSTEDIVALELGKPVAAADWTNPMLLYVGSRAGTCLHVLEDPARTGGAAAPAVTAAAVAKQHATAAAAVVGGWMSSLGSAVSSAVKAKMSSANASSADDNNNSNAGDVNDDDDTVGKKSANKHVSPSKENQAAAAAPASSSLSALPPPQKWRQSTMIARQKLRRCVVDHAGNMLFSICVDSTSGGNNNNSPNTVVTGGQFSVHFFSPGDHNNNGSNNTSQQQSSEQGTAQAPSAQESQQQHQEAAGAGLSSSSASWMNFIWDTAADLLATYKWVQPAPFAGLRGSSEQSSESNNNHDGSSQQQQLETASASAPSVVAFIPNSRFIATVSSDLTSVAWLDRASGKVIKTHGILR